MTSILMHKLPRNDHGDWLLDDSVRCGGGERSKDSGAEKMGLLMIKTRQKCKQNYPVGEKT